MVYLPRIIRYKPLPDYYANLLAEFIGTFFLIITISMSLQQAESVGQLAPIGIGFMLCAFIFCFGYSSGAIYNPAVSVALFMIQLMDLKKAFLYLVAQVSGGICAALVSWFLVGVSDKFKAPAPKSDDAGDIFRSMAAEFIFTFGLMTVIFNVACSRQRDNQHYGLAIGVFVIAAAYAVGGISGGAFNPAVATGLQVVNCMAHNCRDLSYLWLYWISPITGAMCAALTFGLMHPVEIHIDLPGADIGATTASMAHPQRNQNLNTSPHGNPYTPRASGQLNIVESTRASFQHNGLSGGSGHYSNTRSSHGIQGPSYNQQQGYGGVAPHRSPTDETAGAFGVHSEPTAVFVSNPSAAGNINNAANISDESLQTFAGNAETQGLLK